MSGRRVLDLFLIYQFLRRLVTPFNRWDAFKTGVINDRGEVITKKEDRTSEQNSSWGYYDRLLANLKKLLEKIPGGRTRIASFAAALLLLREQNIDADDIEYLSECLNHYMKEAKQLNEQMAGVPTVSAGAGKIAGIGVGPDGEPGITRSQHRRWKKKTKRKNGDV
jgi:hypothetical protein